jgi:hypothetical protein
MRVDLFPYQDDAFFSEKPFILFCSGTGAGKTWLLAPWLVVGALQNYEAPLLAIGPTLKHLKRNLWKEYLIKFLRGQEPYRGAVEHDLVEGVDWIENKTDMTIHFPESGSTIYGAGANEPGSFQGIHARRIGCDEPGLWDREAHDTVRQRIAYGRDRQAFYATTPYDWDYIKTDMYDVWLGHYEEGTLDECDIDFFRVKSIDNPLYSIENYWAEKERLPDWKWEMLYNAEFMRPDGLIFEDWEEIPPFRIPSNWPITIGLDFGFNNPTALIFIAQNPVTQERYVIDEVIERRMILDAIEKEIRTPREIYYEDGGVHMKQTIDTKYCKVFGDAASKGDIETMRAHGINIVPADKEPGSVQAGIRLMDAEFRLRRLKVFNTCVGLKRELKLYSYKKDKEGNCLDEPSKENDHGCDALRYVVYSQRQARKSPGVIKSGRKRPLHGVFKGYR